MIGLEFLSWLMTLERGNKKWINQTNTCHLNLIIAFTFISGAHLIVKKVAP